MSTADASSFIAALEILASDVVVTADLDLLVARRPEALRAALGALARAGFSFELGGEPLLDFEDGEVLSNLVSHGATLVALGAGGVQLDLMLSMTGFGYDELAGDASRFRVGDAEILVGRLEKLLRSKELSNRPKDREFLRLYAARLSARAEDD